MKKFMDKEIDFIYDFEKEQTMVCVDKVVFRVLDKIVPESLIGECGSYNEIFKKLFIEIEEFIHENNCKYNCKYNCDINLLDAYLKEKMK